ncbi:MAG TPA: hypothetical protein VFD30_09065 [Terriglobia bacterium]|jgi:hypothetical protein|nr:hypothetical protein [Terriglobia bacterium]
MLTPECLAWEQVERYRDRTFRRLKSRRVQGAPSALNFINDVGFCTAFSRHEHLPCLWVAICGERHPRIPVHTHSDYAIGLTWDLKDRLPDRRQVFYARLLHGKPSLVSLEYLPYFYRLFGPHGREAGSGALSLTEQGILDWITTHPPQPTSAIRRQGDFRGYLSKARFEKAVARLQSLLYVVKTETAYEPKFTYYWGLFEKTFPEAARRSRRITREEAARKILEKYFRVALCARRRDLVSIFSGFDLTLMAETLDRLVDEGVLLAGARIAGASGSWYLSRHAMMTSY